VKVDIKICGLTDSDDALKALEMGADYVGFVLYPESPRAVTPTGLRRLVDHLPSGSRKIGVFVNSPRQEVERIALDCGLYAIQLNGDESAEDFADLATPVWRAIRFSRGKHIPRPAQWQPVARYVVDSAVAGKYGGTGVKGEWEDARKFARKYPVMLAGGITPANVAEAIRTVKPIGIDTASGVESRPGRKDSKKLKELILAVRRLEDRSRPI
jgi:phosphoribosylanthranilate isomerase